MERLTNQEKFRPWMGFVFFAALMVFFLTVCQLLQYYLGMAGLIMTELLFLGIAVGYCLIRKVKIKEMFPIRDTIWSIMKVLEAKKRVVLSNIQLIPIGKDSLLKNKI